jgi:hypothetical protein
MGCRAPPYPASPDNDKKVNYYMNMEARILSYNYPVKLA